jgi:serine/threonine protein phosphatase PrpC
VRYTAGSGGLAWFVADGSATAGPRVWAVFDGHSGPAVSNFLAQNVHGEFTRQYADGKVAPEEALRNTVAALEKRIISASKAKETEQWLFQGACAGACVLAQWLRATARTQLLTCGRAQ